MKGIIRLVFVGMLSCSICSCGDNKESKKKEQEKEPKKEIKKSSMNNDFIKKAEREDMKKLESGLEYEVLTMAPEGAKKPQAGQRVIVHYTGWLYDEKKEDKLGAKFDSSVDRGRTFSFIVGIGQVIKGWDEGLLDMSIGEKRRLVIPSHLAYGSRGAGGAIPPDAKLVFDVELFDVEDA